MAIFVLTHKWCIICVKYKMSKHVQSIDSKALRRIKGHGKGWVFTPAHFSNLGSRVAIASALKRFKASGIIRQLTRGLYDYPFDHPTLGRTVPSTDAMARALALRAAIRLQPAEAYAANVMGLSEQVPSRVMFLSDGPSHRVKIGQREIVLRHTTPRNMVTAGR